MKQEELQNLLDSLDEGPLGKLKDYEWDRKERASMMAKTFLNQPAIRKKARATFDYKAKGAKMKGKRQEQMLTPEARAKWRETIDMDALRERIRKQGIKNRKPIEVFLKGKSVGKFESCSAAAKVLPIGISSITNLANPNHKTKEVYGYTAKYIKK